MAITETKIYTRPNTTVAFFSESSSLPANVTASNSEFKSNSSYTSTATLSEDQLTQTIVSTYADLSVYSAIDTNLNVYLDSEYTEYTTTNSFVKIARPDQYVQSGISQPFSCTTTWTFPEACAAMDTLSGWVTGQNETYPKLSNLHVVGTTITAIHNYTDSADFTLNHFSEFQFATELAAAGAVRTVEYALL